MAITCFDEKQNRIQNPLVDHNLIIMSNVGNNWELQQSFTTTEQLQEWFRTTCDPANVVVMKFYLDDYYYAYAFSVEDYLKTGCFFYADEARRQRTGDKDDITLETADVYWKHQANVNYTLERAMFYYIDSKDFRGIRINTTVDGHHVFQRMAEPKPASRN